MASQSEVTSFIRSSFRSAWSLELLLVLKKGRPRRWSRAELVAALRASELVVSRGIDELLAAGLVLVDEGDTACYHPLSPALDHIVDQVQALYARSPDAVRRIIVSGTSVGAFADAFRLRKG